MARPFHASLRGSLALLLVAVFALGACTSGDDDGPGAGDRTPISELPGAPTPLADTGVLDPQRPEVGEPAPNFALRDARDLDVVRELADFRGTPVVLNWYASWCGPCRSEIPLFQQAQTALGDSVVFLGVDLIEDQDDALSILDELDATYPALLDTNGAVFDHYRGLGMPTTFFIDADGTVSRQHTGPIEEGQLIEFLAEVGLTFDPDA